MAKITLNIDYDYDFMLFAITAHEPDYKFCHKLNNQLQLAFQKEDPIELKNKNQANQLLFSLYTYINDEQIEYNLLSNKSFNQVANNKQNIANQPNLFSEEDESEFVGQIGYLIPELSNYDYLLIIRAPYKPETAHETERIIKEIDAVLKIQYTDVTDLISKNNLIF